MAAYSHAPLREILSTDGGCSLSEVLSIENLTEDDSDDLREHYHMRMVCEFNDKTSISFTEINNVVETINVTLGDWGLN